MVIVHSGEYAMGYVAGNKYSALCSSAATRDCYMQPIPSGPDPAHPTRIVGEGYDAGCSTTTKPKLWGTQGAYRIFNMDGSKNVSMACMDISSRGQCYVHPGAKACNTSSYPYGLWAQDGIKINKGSDITLTDLDIHGLAGGGVSTNVINNLTMTNVRLAANGMDGYGGDGVHTGTIKLNKVVVEWNGCVETYPGLKPTNCHSWYGDGLGVATTGGDWVIEDSVFRFNVSDGLDLLYHTLGGSITLNRVWAEGNAGNQLKVRGNSTITNSVVVGNCNFFYGKAFTEDVGHCRALGDALSVSVAKAGETVSILNNTILSAGNTVIYGGAASGVAGKMVVSNNILIGMPFTIGATTGAETNSADIYPEPSGNTWTLVDSYNIKDSLRNANCARTGTLCASAGITNKTPGTFNPAPATGSLALNSGVAGLTLPSTDYFNLPRIVGIGFDRGAVEKQ